MQSCINGNGTVSKLIEMPQDIRNSYDHQIKYKYPVARWKHAAVIYENYLYVMGGYSWTNTLKDLWRLDLSALNKVMVDHFKSKGIWSSFNAFDHHCNLWQDLTNFIGHISPLQSHTMVAHKNQLFIFGGAFTYDVKNCPFWIYDIEHEIIKKWKSHDPNVPVPIPRRNHSCCIYRNAMVVYGGFGDIRGSLGDLWFFKIDTQTWHLIWSTQNLEKHSRRGSIKVGPRGRHDHRAVVHKNTLLILGGMSGLEMCNDMWQWNFDEYQWTKLLYKGDHADLSYLADVKINNYWLIFGINDVKKKTEKWIYSFCQNKWTTASYNIPEFNPFSTLLVFSEHHNHFRFSQPTVPQNKSKLNKVYPVSIDSLNTINDFNFESIDLQSCCFNSSAVQVRPLEHYRKLSSYSDLSKETVLTDLNPGFQCETTFINNTEGEDVPIEFYKRELLIILGNNIDKASFDYHLNMQLLHL